MSVAESRVTQKGQVTIPADIRKQLGIKPRDRVRFEVVDDAIKITRATSKILDLYGSVPPRDRPEDFQALRDEFEAGVAEEATRERGS
jgi:antitoxin PrlF